MNLRNFIYNILTIPHVLLFNKSKNHDLIVEDLVARAKYRPYINPDKIIPSLRMALANEKEFRSQFYFRLGSKSSLIKWLLPPIESIHFEGCKNISGGLVLLHGYTTIINGGSKIGKNCTLLHNVTIGSAHELSPTIGDNVFIGTGAIVIGNIRVGNNVKIGAGTVVTYDIPDNCTVVGAKCRIINK